MTTTTETTTTIEAYRELLAAIRDALDVPYPEDPRLNRERDVALGGRVAAVRGSLKGVLDEVPTEPQYAAAALRHMTEGDPVMYAVADDAT